MGDRDRGLDQLYLDRVFPIPLSTLPPLVQEARGAPPHPSFFIWGGTSGKKNK